MYKKMYNVVTVGGPEETLGTAVARTNRLPITGLVEVVKKASRAPSEVLTGRGTTRANYIDSVDLSMEVPMELQATKGTGLLLVSNIGADLATPLQVGAAVRISYTGASASCKLVVAPTTITSTIGALGAESADAAFGTTGVLTLTAEAVDTVAELTAVVNAYTDYSCETLFGATTAPTTAVAIATAQAAGNSVVIYFTSADSGVYLHRFSPVLTNTERPTISLQADGTGLTNDILAGAVVDSISISADLKGRATMSATIMGTAATTGTASTVALAVKKPLKFSGASFFLAGVEHTFVKSFACTVANNHDGDEGFGAGSLYKQDHAKGMFAVTGTTSVRSTTVSEVEYAKRIAESTSSMLAVFQGDALATSIPEMVLVKIPHIEIIDATKSDAGVGLDTELTWEMVDPQSYDEPCTIDMLTTDATKYN
jgi:hypothetical protein